jgi:hypothetical protein
MTVKEFLEIPDFLQGIDLIRFQNNMEARMILRKNYIDWIAIAKDWKKFITLTVDPKKLAFEISQESLIKKVLMLFKALNVDLLGKNYKNYCGKDGYFSWVLSVEPHKSGNLHAHFMVDRPINEELLNIFWNRISGFALLKEIDNLKGAIDYTTKDIVKIGGYIDQYFSKKNPFTPLIKPYWWNEE